MIRERERTATARPGAMPAEWPQGSGLYRVNTAHLQDDSGLLGRIVKRGKSYAAWQYSKGKYLYLGEFATHLRAQQVIPGV